MAKFIIQGGRKLEGKIKVSGSKNAILALIPATLLVEGRVIFENVPRIRDVEVMIKIMEHLGAKINFEGSRLEIDTKNIGYQDLLLPEIKALRASILFLGPVLVKFGKIKIFLPGGDIIGSRPIETHLEGLKNLGAEIEINGEVIEGKFSQFKNHRIILKESSVTATETLIMASTFSSREIQLRLVAFEPHIQALCCFLNLAGYEIEGIGSPFLKIKKSSRLNAKEIVFSVPPDYIEAGSFIALAGATKSKILIEDLDPEELDSVFVILDEMKLNYEIINKSILVKPSKLKAAKKIQTGLYPKFPSDLQPLFGTLATQAEGVTLIHEWMYENRFGYLNELKYMGANVEILDPHRAIIIGPTPLFGKEIQALDIRSGISLLIAGLLAEGQTIINEAEKIDRGYEKIEERLKNLGAAIERVS